MAVVGVDTTDEVALSPQSPRSASRELTVQLLTIAEAAERLCLSRSKVYELIADGELPTVRIGRARRVAATDLLGLVLRHREVG